MIELNKYLKKLQEKCDLSDNFINIISSLLEKLHHFGYISNKDTIKLSKKLLNNIDIVLIGNEKKIDYKSGYYDALRKELYIKDINDLSSIYLRIIYILTTTKDSDSSYITGYAKSSISKDSYKPTYKFYGINRAIVSNLVCRLLYTVPQSLEILPTYRTYSNDFIGKKINSDNNIYFLEGKLLKQLLFVSGVSEEKLYENLFKPKPYNKLNSLFKNFEFGKLLYHFDNISKKYSNYSKLYFFNKLSSEIYVQIRKNSLEKNEIWKETIKKEEQVKKQIQHVLIQMFPSNDDNNNTISEISLNEKIDELEEYIIFSINKYQILLTDILTKRKNNLSKLEYCKLLKKLEFLLITKNDNIQEEIYNVITNHIIKTDELTNINMVKKIKYSLVNDFIYNHKFSNFLDDIKFNIIEDEFQNNKLILIKTDYLKNLVFITDLNKQIKDLNNNIKVLDSKNLKLLLVTQNYKSTKLENLYTKLKNFDKKFENILLDDIYMYSINGTQFLLIETKKETYILGLTKNLDFNILKQSETYSLLK